MDNEKKESMQSLGDRMKSYEDEMKIQIEKNKPFIIRLDGHSFSKFTKKFVKPHDIRIHNAMIETSTILMKTFMPTSIYTFSDEITMCFPSIETVKGLNNGEGSEDNGEEEEQDEIPKLAYNGKVQKLITLTAGLASTVFYKSISNLSLYNEETEPNLVKLIKECTPHFDSRIFTLPSNDEIKNNLIWRSLVDCRRNSVSNLGFAHFSAKEMNGLNNTQVKEKLLKEKNIDYNNEPAWFKYGTYLKKQSYTLTTTAHNDPTKTIIALRTRVSQFSFDISKLSNSTLFVTEKLLPENFQLNLTLDTVNN